MCNSECIAYVTNAVFTTISSSGSRAWPVGQQLPQSSIWHREVFIHSALLSIIFLLLLQIQIERFKVILLSYRRTCSLNMAPIRIGVLALQGSFREHMTLLSRIPGVEAVEVRTVEQLRSVSGLIIPGRLN